MGNKKINKLKTKIDSLIWYHTIDLGGGLITPGIYDHRPYLDKYGIPESLFGKSALDIGTASGFFAFEMEKRGAKVTATDLKLWDDHDFGPNYQPDRPLAELESYLHEPFDLAHRILGSRVKKKKINIYDISSRTVGVFDLVFCSSVLLHLTDPVKALQCIRSVTRGRAIIATGIHPEDSGEPRALFSGHQGGATWWLPNRSGFQAMVTSAGFTHQEWFSDFSLDYSDGSAGTYHGVIHAVVD